MNNTWWLSETDLKEEQRTVVSAPLDESSLILGPPGSGKTNLLLLRAKYFVLAKRDFVLLTFTKTLQGFIASGATQYKISSESILTSRKFFTNLLYSYGIKVSLPEKFEDARKALIEAVQKLVQERGLDQIYESILLDEAHDYLPEEIRLFRHLSKVLVAVADARQMIYKADGSIAALRAAVGHEYELKHHYRSALKICKVADAIAKDSTQYIPLSPSCNYDENNMRSSIEYAAFPSVEAQAEEIVKKLLLQIRAYPDEFIGVICPRNEELTKVWEIISTSSVANRAVLNTTDHPGAFDIAKPIYCSSLHAAKGLEFRALHIAGADMIRRFPYQRNMAFTGVTRAKTSLNIYFQQDLPGFFMQALRVNDPIAALPSVGDLFK